MEPVYCSFNAQIQGRELTIYATPMTSAVEGVCEYCKKQGSNLVDELVLTEICEGSIQIEVWETRLLSRVLQLVNSIYMPGTQVCGDCLTRHSETQTKRAKNRDVIFA